MMQNEWYDLSHSIYNTNKTIAETLWENEPYKFKLGDIVRIKNPRHPIGWDIKDTYIVGGINYQAADSIEYFLYDYPFLVYEEEIELVETQ